jgi:cleavage and polyadenylation specificity factor subunit 4
MAVDQILDPGNHPPHFSFKFDAFLKREYRFGLDADRPACKAFKEGHCPLGNACPDKHHASGTYNSLICKHWMRGLCKKGATCEFLHEFNLRKASECTHWQRLQTCPNGDDCLYLHVDPMSKRPICPWYERGFCPLGPRCADRHVKKDHLCPLYLAGFCPNGKDCREGAHIKWRDDKEMKKPEVFKPKTDEELQKEAEERERQLREEEERETQRDDQTAGKSFGGQQKFGGKPWQNRKRRHGQPRNRRDRY